MKSKQIPSKVTSSNVLFCPTNCTKLRYKLFNLQQYTMKKQKNLTFEKLEPTHFLAILPEK